MKSICIICQIRRLRDNLCFISSFLVQHPSIEIIQSLKESSTQQRRSSLPRKLSSVPLCWNWQIKLSIQRMSTLHWRCTFRLNKAKDNSLGEPHELKTKLPSCRNDYLRKMLRETTSKQVCEWGRNETVLAKIQFKNPF